MKVQTKDLTGAALDWAVAKCRGAQIQIKLDNDGWVDVRPQWNQHHEYRIKPGPEVKKFYVHNPTIYQGNVIFWCDMARQFKHGRTPGVCFC